MHHHPLLFSDMIGLLSSRYQQGKLHSWQLQEGYNGNVRLRLTWPDMRVKDTHLTIPYHYLTKMDALHWQLLIDHYISAYEDQQFYKQTLIAMNTQLIAVNTPLLDEAS